MKEDSRNLRRITRSATRYYNKNGNWPAVARVASEHKSLSTEDVILAAGLSDSVEIMAGKVVVVDYANQPPEERTDDKGRPPHLKALDDAQRVSRGLEPRWYHDVPAPRSVNWSRNIFWMRTYVAVVQTLRDFSSAGNGVPPVSPGFKRASERRDQVLLHMRESLRIEDHALMANEIFPEWTYASWSAIARIGLWVELKNHDQKELADQLEKQLRREVALWRLAGLDEITVRRNNRVVYKGPGARTAGSRKLPKSGPELSMGVLDTAFANLIGITPTVDRWRGKSDSLEDELGIEAEILDVYRDNIFKSFIDLRHRDVCVHTLERDGARTRAPLVIERYKDGSVSTWLEWNPSLETGCVFWVHQRADGNGYDHSWLYDRDDDTRTDERVRKGHPDLGFGSVTGRSDGNWRILDVKTVSREGRDKSRPHLHGQSESITIPPRSDVDMRIRTSADGPVEIGFPEDVANGEVA